MEKNMAEEKFLIENYGKKGTFASFLPGISGEKGIPIWCYYVNRGQCVVSFGVDNKDHSIMEFYPAHQAYQNVKTTGFRTFVKKDGKVTELFADENQTHRMEIAMNGLKIEEENDVLGVNAKVTYFTLPGEKIGALVRRVELTNTTGEYANLCYDRERGGYWKSVSEYLPVRYPGTGDLFAAVLTAGLMQGDSPAMAMDRATRYVEITVKTTFGYGADSREGVMLERTLGWLTQKELPRGYRTL